MNFILLLQLLQGICHFITSPILVFPALLTEFEVIVRVSKIIYYLSLKTFGKISKYKVYGSRRR